VWFECGSCAACWQVAGCQKALWLEHLGVSPASVILAGGLGVWFVCRLCAACWHMGGGLQEGAAAKRMCGTGCYCGIVNMFCGAWIDMVCGAWFDVVQGCSKV
jgi:hypothetical protein